MFYLFGISITFFLSVLLIGKKNKSEADYILAGWLVFMGIHQTGFYLFISEKYLSFPYHLGFEIPMPFVHGPFLYLYTCSLTGQMPKRGVALLHFIPFLFCYFLLYEFLVLPFDQKIQTYQNKGAGYETLMGWMNIGIILSGISYVLLSLLRLAKHKKNIAEQFSYTDKINLSWLRYLIAGIGIIWLAVIFGVDAITFSIVVVFVFFMGYFGIKQVNIFTPEHAPPELSFAVSRFDVAPAAATAGESSREAEKGKYEKSGLKEGDMERIHDRLKAVMEREKAFADPELTLADLAKKLEVHPNYLSQVINTLERKNFFDYINAHRVEAFKRLVSLPGSRQFTLLSLAFDCGFNSKTSFNRNFKKSTGLTPSEYLSQMNIHLS